MTDHTNSQLIEPGNSADAINPGPGSCKVLGALMCKCFPHLKAMLFTNVMLVRVTLYSWPRRKAWKLALKTQ